MSRLRKFFEANFDIPSFEISPEREEELIEKLARLISRIDMELPLQLLAWGFYPTATILSYTALIGPASLLEVLGIKAYEYVALLGNKENVKRLISRLDELRRAKEKAGR